MNEGAGRQLRIGDAERESAVTALGEHYAAGRLTKEEYDERSDRAYGARTAADLWPLFADLPGPQSGRPASGSSDRRSEHGEHLRQGPRGWSGPVGPGPWAPRSRHWWPAVVPVLVVLGVLTVLTHLPFLLLLLVAWLVWSGAVRGRHGGYRRDRYRYDDSRRW